MRNFNYKRTVHWAEICFSEGACNFWLQILALPRSSFHPIQLKDSSDQNSISETRINPCHLTKPWQNKSYQVGGETRQAVLINQWEWSTITGTSESFTMFHLHFPNSCLPRIHAICASCKSHYQKHQSSSAQIKLKSHTPHHVRPFTHSPTTTTYISSHKILTPKLRIKDMNSNYKIPLLYLIPISNPKLAPFHSFELYL